jgi:DNA-binding transcriptional MocR family regulator
MRFRRRNGWRGEASTARITRWRAADSGALFRYGDRLGYAPLRHRLVRRLADVGIDARPQQIVLTHGANQAMDLIVRYSCHPAAWC